MFGWIFYDVFDRQLYVFLREGGEFCSSWIEGK